MNTTDSEFAMRIKNAIIEIDPTAQVILFGSRARGNAKPNSDWDILVLLNKQNLKLKDNEPFLNKIFDIELETLQSISPIIYSVDYWNRIDGASSFHQNVTEEGFIL